MLPDANSFVPHLCRTVPKLFSMTKRFTLLQIENLDMWMFGISHASHFEANCSAMSRFMVANRLSAGWAQCVALHCCWCPELASCCDCIWCLTGSGNWHMFFVSHGNSTFHRQSWQHVTLSKGGKKNLTIMYAYESGDEKREKQRFHCSGVNVFHISVEEKKKTSVNRLIVITRESGLCLFYSSLSCLICEY